MKDFLFQFASNKPKQLYSLLLLVVCLCIALIFNIKIDTDPENMLPEQQPDRVFHNQIKQEFNLHDAIVVGAVTSGETIYTSKSLKSIVELTENIIKIDGVINVDLMSLSVVDNIRQEKGALRFEWMMKQAPTSVKESEQIQKNVERLPLLRNTLVSQDHKAAAIYVPIKSKDESYQISLQIEQLIDDMGAADTFYITGLPVAEDTFGFEMFVQMGISAPLAAAMIFVLMFIFFRNLKFVSAPMIVAMATVIIVMGLMIGMGFTVHIMSSMIPIFLMPIAVVDSIHIMSEFADHYKKNKDKQAVIKNVVDNLYKPMLFTSLTSAVGFASLMLTPIPPVQVFGAFVAFGILLAFILTITFIPAYITSLKDSSLESLARVESTGTVLEKILPKMGGFSQKNSKFIVALFSLLVVLSIVGINKIVINDNPTRWFKADHKIRVADKVLNEHFAGTYDSYLVFESDTSENQKAFASILDEAGIALDKKDSTLSTKINEAIIAVEDKLFEEDSANLESAVTKLEALKSRVAIFQQPEVLGYMEKLQDYLNQSDLIGKSMGLVDAVKTVNRDLKSGSDKDYALPNSQEAVAQTLLQYQSSHRPHDLWHFVNQGYSTSVVWLQMTSGDNQDMSKVVELVDNYIAKNPLPTGLDVKWAGKTYLNKVWQDEMVNGMLTSLLSAFVVVLLMMIFLFRSIWLGVIAMLPLTITITAIYGLIGWMGKDYDMPIAVLSSLTLGLSIDFAIHFVQRTRDIYQKTNNIKLTMVEMFKDPAMAISRNAIVIAIGFTPLLVAPLVPYITVGFFLATIMAVSALVTLLLLPIALTKARQKL